LVLEREFHKEDNITKSNVVTLGEVYLELLTIESKHPSESLKKYLDVEGAIYPHIIVPAVPVPADRFLNDTDEPEKSVYRRVPKIFLPRKEEFVSAMAWHSLRQKFALSLRDDHICLYDLNFLAASTITLFHQYQKDILCMEWKPCSPNTLAVGCKNGVLIWQILRQLVETSVEFMLSASSQIQGNPPTQILQDRNAYAKYLSYPELAPVNCITWSPDGRFLACGSFNASFIVIRDLHTDSSTTLKIPNGGITVLRWSPNGHFLFAGGTTIPMIIWETMYWNCYPWTNFPKHTACIAAAWSTDSSYIAMAVSSDPKLYIFSPGPSGRLIHTEILSEYTYNEHKFCGLIKEIAWGGVNSERIAVSFINSPYICVLSVFKKIPLVISPLGYIKGPQHGGNPRNLLFRPNFPRGALLSACWENGKVSFYPMYYRTKSLT